jgi:hypothetical protein
LLALFLWQDLSLLFACNCLRVGTLATAVTKLAAGPCACSAVLSPHLLSRTTRVAIPFDRIAISPACALVE